MEAALIVPLFLFLFVLTIDTGIRMYTECRDTAEAICGEKDMKIVEKFYFWQGIGGIWEDED